MYYTQFLELQQKSKTAEIDTTLMQFPLSPFKNTILPDVPVSQNSHVIP